MDDQLRSFLANLSNENNAEPKSSQAKSSQATPRPAKPQEHQEQKPQEHQEHMVDEEVQQALAICGGDAVAALRITLIANAFLEAELEELKTQISAGFQRKRNPARVKTAENPMRTKRPARALKV